MFNVITFDFTKNTQFIQINEDYLEQRALLLEEGVRGFLHPFSTRPAVPAHHFPCSHTLPDPSGDGACGAVHMRINLNPLLLARPAPFLLEHPMGNPHSFGVGSKAARGL